MNSMMPSRNPHASSFPSGDNFRLSIFTAVDNFSREPFFRFQRFNPSRSMVKSVLLSAEKQSEKTPAMTLRSRATPKLDYSATNPAYAVSTHQVLEAEVGIAHLSPRLPSKMPIFRTNHHKWA